MSKYLMKSAAAIVLGLAATACSLDLDFVEKVEQQSIDNAQQTLGFYIPENQDWKMSSEANVNVTIPGDANETYTVMIFSNNPLEDGIGYYLTKQTLNGGQNLATDVAYPMHLRSLVIGITDSNGTYIYEHDFVCVGYGDKAYVTEVTYEDGCWCTQDGTCTLHEEFCGGDDVRVVGTNITDRLENFYENIHGADYVKEEYL